MSGNFRFLRSYVGPVRGVILDWSGTLADKYVLAPTVVFVELFKKYKVPITMSEAREPMGLRKDLHIKKITENDGVRERWHGVYGRYPNDDDVQNMAKDFIPMVLGCLPKYSTLIPGAAESCNILKKEFDIKIGSTTGFLRPMVDILLQESKKQGYCPDASVAGDEVENGVRPKPFMIYKNMDIMDVHPIQAVVKVDDTVSGIFEAMEAGCWGVGVAKYSNYMDIDSLEDAEKLTQEEENKRLIKTRQLLTQAGAHYVVDSVADLPEVINDINVRLARGDKP